jgi:hypothetical protein
MHILNFEIVDLGPLFSDWFDDWGASYRQTLNSSVIGQGPTAKAAFLDAMNKLALEGFATSLVQEVGIEMGLFSAQAETDATKIELHCEINQDDFAEDEPDGIVYHIGIRYESEQAEVEV